MNVWVEPYRRLSAKELMLSNHGAGEVPCIARSNQSILKEINLEYSLEGLMLKLKLQYFGHLMWRVNSLEKTLMLGKIEGKGEGGGRGWDVAIASLTQWIWISANSTRQYRTEDPDVLQPVGVTESQTQYSKWKTIIRSGDWGNDHYFPMP